MNSKIKTQAFKAFDMLTDKQQNLIYELIMALAPDDITSTDDVLTYEEAVKAYQNGDVVSHSEVKWD
jgi:hypothetical protein